MNVAWISNPFVIYFAVLLAVSATLFHLAVTTRDRLRRQQKCHLAESQSLRDAIAGLEARLQSVCVEVQQNMVPPANHIPGAGLNVHKRAEALRMSRRGSDNHTICTALGLPGAEVALLQKVHHLLNGGVVA